MRLARVLPIIRVEQEMLRIQRSSDDIVVFSLSGRIETQDIPELRRLFSFETSGQEIALDLEEVVLIERDAVKFLRRCEAEKIRLKNCPAYIRQWMQVR